MTFRPPALGLAGAVVFVAEFARAQEAPPAPPPPAGWTDAPAPAPPTEPTRAPDVPPPAPAPPPARPPAGAAAGRAASVNLSDSPRPRPDAPWPPPASKPKTRFVVGAGLGLVGGRFAHDMLVDKGFRGLGLMTHVSYAVSRSLLVGLGLDVYRTSVDSVGSGKYGLETSDSSRSGLEVSGSGGGGDVRLTSKCIGCDDQGGGFFAKAGPVNVMTLGPRLQYAPDPARGFFGSVSGGVTMLEGMLPNRTAGAVGAQGGYRLALSEQVGVALEVGASAHRFSSSTAAFGFGALQLQMRL